jgi:hypothetical protein
MTDEAERPARPLGLPVNERQAPRGLKALQRRVGRRFEFRAATGTKAPYD